MTQKDMSGVQATGFHHEHGIHAPVVARRRVRQCLKLTPWFVFLTAGFFATGLVFWITGVVAARDQTLQLARALAVDESAASWLRNSVTTTVVAITIGGSAIVALALILSIVRAVERGLLISATANGSSDAPPPWLFTGYRVVATALNLTVWLLLAACIGILTVMAVWWGAFAALSHSLESGVAAGDAALSQLGLSVRGASDVSALVASALGGTPLAPVVSGGGALPFAPVCAPVCLNAGSFAQLLRMQQSCVCGLASLDAARAAATAGARGAGVGLAGAAAVWLASCLLLVSLAGHYVTAGFDRKSALYCHELRAEMYERGFTASPSDCFPVDVVLAAAGDAPTTPAGGQPADQARSKNKAAHAAVPV